MTPVVSDVQESELAPTRTCIHGHIGGDQNPADVLVYRGHNHATSVAKFSPSGNWVASGDASGRVRVWAWDNPEHILKLEVRTSTYILMIWV